MAKGALAQYLRHFFGGANPNGTRFQTINNAHVVHESGYEVTFGRTSVTYRDSSTLVNLDAEHTPDLLVVYSSECDNASAVQRIKAALTHLGVKHVHE